MRKELGLKRRESAVEGGNNNKKRIKKEKNPSTQRSIVFIVLSIVTKITTNTSQSSIINCHITNTVYVVHQTTEINRTVITKAVITIIQLIQLRHSPHSYHRVPSWQFTIKRKVQSLQSSTNQSSNNCLGWVVGPDYGV